MSNLFTIFFSFLVYLTVFSEVDLNSILLNKKVSSNSNNLKFIQASNITNLDPIEIDGLDSVRFFKYLYDTLFYFDNDKKLKSNLIKTWNWKTELVLKKIKTITIQLILQLLLLLFMKKILISDYSLFK